MRLVTTLAATVSHLNEQVACLQAERKAAEIPSTTRLPAPAQVVRGTAAYTATPPAAGARFQSTTISAPVSDQAPRAPATSARSPFNQAFTKYTWPTLPDNAGAREVQALVQRVDRDSKQHNWHTVDVAAKVMHECLNDDLWGSCTSTLGTQAVEWPTLRAFLLDHFGVRPQDTDYWLRQFERLKQRPSESLMAYMTRCRALYGNLCATGYTRGERARVRDAIRGFRDESLATALCWNPSIDTLAALRTIVHAEQERRDDATARAAGIAAATAAPEAAADASVGVAAATAAPNSAQPPAPCRYCGGPHWNRFCPSRPKSKGSPGGPRGPCFNCNQQGHYARDCPRKATGGGSSKDTPPRASKNVPAPQAESSDSSDDERRRHKRKHHKKSKRSKKSKKRSSKKREHGRRRRKRDSSSSSSSESDTEASSSGSDDGDALYARQSKLKQRVNIHCVGVRARDADCGPERGGSAPGTRAVTTPHVRVMVGGEPFVALLDTGAETSLVTERMVALCRGPGVSRYQLVDPLSLHGVTGDGQRISEAVRLSVHLGECKLRHAFNVVPGDAPLPGAVDLILGYDFIHPHRINVVHTGSGVQLYKGEQLLSVGVEDAGVELFAAPYACGALEAELEAGDAWSAVAVRRKASDMEKDESDTSSEDSDFELPADGDVEGMLVGLEAAFSSGPDDLGHVSCVEHHIPTGEARLPSQPSYTTAPPTQRKMIAHVQMWQLLGVCQPSTSSISSPMVLVSKKDYNADGTRARPPAPEPITDEVRQADRIRSRRVRRILGMPAGPARQHAVQRLLPELVAIAKGTRCCINYRALNAVTENDATPILASKELFLHCPVDTCLITTLDMRSAYQAIEIAPEDRWKTAFRTPLGVMEFVRLPFGLKTAPHSMARLGLKLTEGLLFRDVLIFYDDLAVLTPRAAPEGSGTPWQRHVRAVRRVLRRCIALGVKLGKPKCVFAASSADWVDRNISEAGLRKRDDHVAPLMEWPVPTTAKSLGRFLNVAGYYRDFVAGFARVTAPLKSLVNAASKPGARFQWNDAHQAAFDALKARIKEDVVLAVPDFSKPFQIETDASDVAIGGVLVQQDDDGRDRPVAFVSRGLTGAESRYGTTERELLAVLWAIDRFRVYIQDAKFRVVTDHANLQWLFRQRRSGRIGRWVLRLMEYDFDVVHKAGHKHVVPDALSRIVRPRSVQEMIRDAEATDIPESLVELGIAGVAAASLGATKPAVAAAALRLTGGGSGSRPGQSDHPTPTVVLPALDELAAAQRDDVEYQLIIEGLEGSSASAPTVPYHPGWRYDLDLEAEGGVLVVVDDKECQRAVIPAKLRHVFIMASHEGHGHQGQRRTLEKLQRRVYWPKMEDDVKEHCRTCLTCCRIKSRKPKHGKMKTWFSNVPLSAVHMDIVGPFVESFEGYKYVLTARCRYSRWSAAIPLRTMLAEEVAQAFLQGWVYTLGSVPDYIVTDRGSQFTGNLLKHLSAKLGVQQRFTSAYHPQTNQVERYHRDLTKTLASYTVDAEHRDWPSHIGVVTWALNTTPSRATGYSPFEMLFGMPASTPFSMVAASRLPAPKTVDEYVKRLHDRLYLIHTEANKQQQKLADANKRQYDRDRVEVSFSIGDYVLVHDTVLKGAGGSRKLNPSFTKPAKVVAKISKLVYVVQLSDRRRRNKGLVKCHISRLLKFEPRHEPLVKEVRRRATAAAERGDTQQEPSVSTPSSPHGKLEAASDMEVLRIGHGHQHLVHLIKAGVLTWLPEEDVPREALDVFRKRIRDRDWRSKAKEMERQLVTVTVDD